eukprot:TRINITY_DN20828_c0_g2_i1.p1 TRINITY_DN20828_c0_g2~~TRINITY_DN20828_c0_g2_i1.p1  ORF type:complete len:308 (-),score=97.81 TRINITY_DN20828_c0_g2_i1:84-1007(-)
MVRILRLKIDDHGWATILSGEEHGQGRQVWQGGQGRPYYNAWCGNYTMTGSWCNDGEKKDDEKKHDGKHAEKLQNKILQKLEERLEKLEKLMNEKIARACDDMTRIVDTTEALEGTFDAKRFGKLEDAVEVLTAKAEHLHDGMEKLRGLDDFSKNRVSVEEKFYDVDEGLCAKFDEIAAAKLHDIEVQLSGDLSAQSEKKYEHLSQIITNFQNQLKDYSKFQETSEAKVSALEKRAKAEFHHIERETGDMLRKILRLETILSGGDDFDEHGCGDNGADLDTRGSQKLASEASKDGISGMGRRKKRLD